MAHKQRTHHRNTPVSPAAAARVQAALSATTEQSSPPRHRFVWNFLAGLSALALGVYYPAMPSDVRAEDWKPTPREPEQDNDPWNPVDKRDDQRRLWRPDWKQDRYRSPHPTIRVAENEELQGGSKQRFDIPAGELEEALISFSNQTGIQSLYPSDLVAGRRTQGLQGDYTSEEALQGILAGTGLHFLFSSPRTVTLQLAGRSEDLGPPPSSLSEPDEKPIKVQEIVVKERRERPVIDAPPGYKADLSSSVTRSNMAIQEIPTSIGVVTRDLLKDTFSRTQGDAFEAVSGVSRDQVNGARSEGFSIRGFTGCSPAGSFNGMKVNGLPDDCLFAPDWGIVERYEIIKGPASIIGGAANPGGVVNRITKTPQRSNFANVAANFGSYDYYRGLVDVNGILPKYENIRGRLVVAVEEGGNFVDLTPVRQYTVHPSVEFNLFNGAGRLLLVGTYQKFDGANYLGWPLTTDGKMLNVPRTRNFGGGASVGAHTNFTGYQGQVHYDHQFIHGIKLIAKGKYQRSKLTDNSIYSYTYGGIPPSGDSYLTNGFRDLRLDTYAGELFLSKEFSLFGQKQEILTGADYRDMTRNSFLAFPTLPVDGPPFFTDNVFNPRNGIPVLPDSVLRSLAGPPLLTTLKQTGVFGQAVIRPLERVTLVLAGRHDEARSTINDSAESIGERTDSTWTGRGGVTVKVTEWMNVYGGVQQSFAPQTLSFTRDNQILKPETGINYELGAKFDLLNERLRITTALFRTYRRNVATRDPGDPQFSIAIGEQRHQGVEFDVNGHPIPGLSLNASFMYLDAVITKANDPGFVGSYPAAVPRNYIGRVFANYQLQSGPLQGFGSGAASISKASMNCRSPTRSVPNPITGWMRCSFIVATNATM